MLFQSVICFLCVRGVPSAAAHISDNLKLRDVYIVKMKKNYTQTHYNGIVPI